MILTETLDAYQARKLYIFNCGHAITAYLGTIFQHEVISDAIADQHNIFPTVEGAMRESGRALVKEYPHVFREDDIEAHIQKNIGRFRNSNVVDNVTRVGRNPLRKLGSEERLLGPFHLAKKHDLPTKHLVVGIAAALMYRNDEDEQAVELRNIGEKDGVGGVIVKVLGFQGGSEDYKGVMRAYRFLEDCRKTFNSKERN